ncbi:MAG: HAD hydrolase-like protein [Muribaculaceae bacterium]|nr:HAD hydrolase-like protein [Muribaculaceae bacterium]
MTDLQQSILQYRTQHGIGTIIPKAFLFDMDGTLYDSMPNHAGAWYRMITEQGIPATPEEFFLYEGSTGADTINKIFRRTYGREATASEIERMYARKAELFTTMPQPDVMPGARRLVDYVKSLPWHPAVVLVTGSGQGSLLDRLNTDFNGAFPLDMRVTAHNVTKGKPHPHPYLKGMELAAVNPWESIAIENAPLGVESARRSGAFTVAVTTGPVPAEAMTEAGAHIVYKSMEECAASFPAMIASLTEL